MKLANKITALLFCTIAVSVHAKEVTCPSINEIHDASNAIDAIELEYNTTYAAYSTKPAFYHDDLNWKIKVHTLQGSKEDIINQARKTVSKVLYRHTNKAEKSHNGYSCLYSWTGYDSVVAYAENN